MFKKFAEKLQKHFAEATGHLFIADVDKDKMWEKYLKAFPKESNPIYRERTEHDCSCCRHFIKSVGNVVWFDKNGKRVSIWDCKYGEDPYKTVAAKMSKMIQKAPIRDVFVPCQKQYGTEKNYEDKEDGGVITYHHFVMEFPSGIVMDKVEIPTYQNDKRTTKQVFKRSLDEITVESVDSVLDLISQNSLYKGEEWQQQLITFSKLQTEYLKVKDQDAWAWQKSIEVGPVIGRIRNHSIGTLLTDLSEGRDIEEAVSAYEKMVAPTNYKRPKAIFTQKMIDNAKKTLKKLGLAESLERRFAVLDDITVNDILFANKDTAKKMKGSAIDDLKPTKAPSSRKFDKLEEIPIEKFVKDVLPRVSNLEVMLEGCHENNLVSVIAPATDDAPSLFKWDNGFSWAYNGNITDSIRQNVQKAGGKVDGVLRFSIQWNDRGDFNMNDFDAHAVEPNGEHISFHNMRSNITGGNLDVDILNPVQGTPAVENIVWPDLRRMTPGGYRLFVHNFTHRGGTSGFRAEIEADGEVYAYNHEAALRLDERVEVATAVLDRNGKFTIKGLKASSRDIWGLQTQQFHPVSLFMYSPNHWEGAGGIGHRHYFFVIDGCRNDTRPNGFFNEFLKEDLMEHKRVFEALGSKMRVEDSDEQLSGIGFSSTKRNHVVCKLDGATSRVVKVVF